MDKDDTEARAKAYNRYYLRYYRTGDYSHMEEFYAKFGERGKRHTKIDPNQGRIRGKIFGNWKAIKSTKIGKGTKAEWLCRNIKTQKTKKITVGTLRAYAYRKSHGSNRLLRISAEHHRKLTLLEKIKDLPITQILENLIDSEYDKSLFK